MIELGDLKRICFEHTPVKTGNMQSSWVFYENPHVMVASINLGRAPYARFQEEGFKHYISGKMVTKNQGFISKRIVGSIMNESQGHKTTGNALDKSVESNTSSGNYEGVTK
jgi:hypothetical protein